MNTDNSLAAENPLTNYANHLQIIIRIVIQVQPSYDSGLTGLQSRLACLHEPGLLQTGLECRLKASVYEAICQVVLGIIISSTIITPLAIT